MNNGRKSILSKILVIAINKWGKYLTCKEKLLLRSKLSEIQALDCAEYKIYLHVDSMLELQTRIHSCRKEPMTVEWLQIELRPGDVFYDIGANVGAYSLFAAIATEGKAKVYAFEPSFQNYYQLCRNIILNDCQNSITPLHIPLCKKTYLDRFYYENMEIGGSLHSFSRMIDYKAEKFAPKAFLDMVGFSMDDLSNIPGVKLPNLLKIDVDGLEYDILMGAEKVLMHNGLRSLLIEINEDLVEEAENIINILHTRGFVPKEKHHLHRGLHNYNFVRSINSDPPEGIANVRLASCRKVK